MKKMSATNLIWATENLSRVEMQIRLLGKSLKEKPDDRLLEEFLKSLRRSIESLETVVQQSNAPVTLVAVRRIKAELSKEPCTLTYKSVGESYNEILTRLSDEASTGVVLSLDADEARMYEPNEALFGELVSTVFPDAHSEAEEAGKCLATGRYTAVVFHLMRAMESALKIISSELGVQNVEKEWGKLLSDISSKIEAMPKGDRRDRWSASHSHLYHVKQAWRNNTMHPKKTYTEEEARAVFSAVKSFLVDLADLTKDK